MEHRWGQRIATDVPVNLVGAPAAIGVGRILNASVTGALVQTRLPLRLLSLVYIETAESMSYLGPIGRLVGCVIRRGAGVIGIEWCDADADEVLRLLAALRDDAPPSSRAATAFPRRRALPIARWNFESKSPGSRRLAHFEHDDKVCQTNPTLSRLAPL